MRRILFLTAVLAYLTFSLAACGGGTGGNPSPSSQSAVFITGEDAPLASVVGFNVALQSITLNNSSGSVQILAQPTTVDFARLVGMRSLIGFNSVASGTYDSATFTLSAPVISYLNLTTSPASVSTLNGTFTNSTVTVAFPHAMTVAENGLAGLHMEFNLRQSLQVDSGGELTGVVDPHIHIEAVAASDDDGKITDLGGGLVSVNVAANSFVIQRVGGFQVTVKVDSQTQFNGAWSLGTLTTPAFVSVQGKMQADGSILAEQVEVIATQHAFVSGRIVAVNPTSGAAQTVTLFVGEELPAISNIAVGSVTTLDVSTVSDFAVCFFDNWFTDAIFNNTSLVVGQRIFVAGDYDGTTFTPKFISLRRQGVVGDLVQSSVNITAGERGSFQLQNNHLFGYVVGGPLTVQTGVGTRFHGADGLAGLEAAGSANLLVGGIVLKDQSSGTPQMWSHNVRVLQ